MSSSEKKRVALISVFAAVFLTSIKLAVGAMTGSLGILSEAFHSGLDLLAAIITLQAVKFSSRPSDSTHHYGHGKIENLSAIIETLLLLVVCGWVVYEATHRIIVGGSELMIKVNVFSYLVVITSIVIDVWRSKKLYKVAKKYKSQALEADALHFSTDIWSSSVVLLGLICVSIGEYTGIKAFYYADSVAALGVAVLVIFVSYQLGKRAIDALLDAAPEKESKDVEQIIKDFPEVITFHDLRVRQSGHQLLIEATIHVESGLSLAEAHIITDKLEAALLKYDEFIIANIHVEPHKH